MGGHDAAAGAAAAAREAGAMSAAEAYALGLLVEECGEVAQCVGKAIRFGLGSPQANATTRAALALEIGDLLAAVEYALKRNLVDADTVYLQRSRKLLRLLDPESRDNLGRRLAP